MTLIALSMLTGDRAKYRRTSCASDPTFAAPNELYVRGLS